MTKSVGRFLSGLSALVFLMLACMANASAIEIKRVSASSGVTALLVEDYTLPIISMAYSFRGGSTQDTEAKSGTVRLMASLIDEGAGEYDSAGFRSRLEEFGIDFGFSSSTDFLGGSLRVLRSDRAVAFEMLQLALNQPRFDPEAIERMRDAIRTGIIRAQTSPGSVAAKAIRETLFGEHPYALPSSGDIQSIEAVDRQDIVAMYEKLFAREHLVVGVVGAINEEELKAALDKIFGELPLQSGMESLAGIEPQLGKAISIEMPAPNPTISLVYKGLKRDHPDFFAAHIMNHVLGGGTFSSRLYTEVREKRGLAYGVSSGIGTFSHSAYLSAGTSTRAENQEETIRIIRQVIEEVAETGITQEELDAAKKYVIGSYAINNLDTSGKIARVLVAIQSQNLGIDYIDRRRELIENVTLADVNRVAHDLLSVEPTQVIVGPVSQ